MAFKLLITLLFITHFSFADSVSEKISTESFSTLNKKPLLLSTFVEIPTHSFLISTDAGRVDQKQVSQRIQYNPTFAPNIGVRGLYEQWGLSYSQKLYFSNPNDEVKYGKTKYDEVHLSYQFNDFISLDSYYQNYHGFYTDLNGQEGLQTTFGNTTNTGSTPTGDSNIVNRSDISTQNYGLRTIFTIPLVPFFKLFASNEAKDSAPGWDFNLLSKLYYNHLGISGNTALVPSATTNSFSPISSLKEFSTNTLGAGLGLGILAHPSNETVFGFEALAGPGFQRQVDTYSDHTDINYTTATELNAKIFIDWAGKIHGFRADLHIDTISSQVKDINFDSSSLGLNLVYSYNGLSF